MRHLRSALSRRADRYSAGRPDWLRVDPLDGIFAITPWASSPLSQQLDMASALVELLRSQWACVCLVVDCADCSELLQPVQQSHHEEAER